MNIAEDTGTTKGHGETTKGHEERTKGHGETTKEHEERTKGHGEYQRRSVRGAAAFLAVLTGWLVLQLSRMPCCLTGCTQTHTDTHTHIQRERETDGRTDKQTDRQTNRQMYRQTDKHIESEEGNCWCVKCSILRAKRDSWKEKEVSAMVTYELGRTFDQRVESIEHILLSPCDVQDRGLQK